MTLLELLVVMAIILALLGLLFPAASVLRNSAHSANARHLVLTLGIAMRAYADEDQRHFFPTPRSDQLLTYDPADPGAILSMLEQKGFPVPTRQIATPGHELLDDWGRPLHYVLDGPYLSGGVVTTAAMNGVADRPAADTAWNPKSVEPWAYLWSLGRPTSAGDAADALPANAAAWIYERGAP